MSMNFKNKIRSADTIYEIYPEGITYVQPSSLPIFIIIYSVKLNNIVSILHSVVNTQQFSG